MFKTNKLTKLIVSLGIGLTLTMGYHANVNAQDTNDGFQSNEKDPTFGDAPGGLNPLDLIHKSQQGNIRNADEFSADSQGQINSSVSDYKLLQQQRILEQQQSEATQVVETEIIK